MFDRNTHCFTYIDLMSYSNHKCRKEANQSKGSLEVDLLYPKERLREWTVNLGVF